MVHTLAREVHQVDGFLESYTYTDGFGRVAMKKVQAEPGPLFDANGNVVVPSASPRWVGTGRTVFNNKGNPVKQYEPFFSATFEFENEATVVQAGVTPIIHYDALDRGVRTELPTKSIFACPSVVLKGSAVAIPSIAARLVVSADGFGMTVARSHGVLAAHRRGIVTSASVLGNAADVEQVARDLREAPCLGVGVLLTLVDGMPVTRPETVPSLVGTDGRFPARPQDVLLAWAKATLRPEDIEREFDAQVARLRDLGLTIDYLSTRAHLGFLPVVAHAVENVARKHGIAGLRMTVEKPTVAWAAELPRGLATTALGALAWFTRRELGPRRHGPQTWGYFESGRLDEIRILEILGRMGPGIHEIICQPDLDPALQIAPPRSELSALMSARVRDAITRRNIELCRWSDLF